MAAPRLAEVRAGGDDGAAPFRRRQGGNFFARDPDTGMLFQHFGDGGGKTVAVHRQGAARRQLVGVGGAHHQRAGAPHFFMQQAHGIVLGIVGTEGIGTDQFRQRIGLMGLGTPEGPHFVQNHFHAALGGLPGSFRTGQAAADDVKGFFHGLALSSSAKRRAKDYRPKCPDFLSFWSGFEWTKTSKMLPPNSR